jgi:hypothetical protein
MKVGQEERICHLKVNLLVRIVTFVEKKACKLCPFCGCVQSRKWIILKGITPAVQISWKGTHLLPQNNFMKRKGEGEATYPSKHRHLERKNLFFVQLTLQSAKFTTSHTMYCTSLLPTPTQEQMYLVFLTSASSSTPSINLTCTVFWF